MKYADFQTPLFGNSLIFIFREVLAPIIGALRPITDYRGSYLEHTGELETQVLIKINSVLKSDET